MCWALGRGSEAVQQQHGTQQQDYFSLVGPKDWLGGLAEKEWEGYWKNVEEVQEEREFRKCKYWEKKPGAPAKTILCQFFPDVYMGVLFEEYDVKDVAVNIRSK